jgi:glycosyltransferase involved in cell wall biosynthesis
VEGGVSHYTQILARHLVDMGEQLIVVTNDDYQGTETHPSLDVITLPGAWNGRAARDIFDTLSTRSVDLVNLQYSPSMYTTSFKWAWGVAAKRLASVTSFHTLWGGGKINYWFALQLLGSSKAVVATNTEIVHLLEKYLPFFLKKVRQIPIGSNIRPLAAPRYDLEEKYKLRRGVPIVSYFGMCYPGKGMAVLFETAKLLKKSLDFRMLVIGGGMSDDETHYEQAREKVRACGVDDNVTWTGRLAAEDVSTLLSRSDVVLLPYELGVSDRRGSLMAALAHGKAIVTAAPSIPGFPFKRWENMVWPDSYDAKEFAELVARVLDDNQLRSRLGSGARLLAEEYQWPSIAKRTRDFFFEITSGA